MRNPIPPAFALAFLAACTTLASPAPAATETATVTDSANPLPLERLFQSPSLSGASPRSLKFSPDGQRVSFLKPREDDAARLDLWAYDVATGEADMLVDSQLLEPDEVELSEQEKALRERQRIAGSKGIVSYDWGDANTLLVPLGGDLYLVDLGEAETNVRRLTETDAFEFDARLSPNGNYVSFIRDNALWVTDLITNIETRISPEADPANAISYGVAEFVAQEEMSRYTGYWWSPDEAYIAYSRVDESTVDIIPRFDIAAEDVTVIEQRYPRAGRPNAVVELLIHDLSTGEAETRLSVGPDDYLAQVDWRSDGVVAQTVNRDQTEITVTHYAPGEAGGTVISVANEIQPNWINLSHEPLRFGDWRGGEQDLLFRSERSGFSHIWLAGETGAAEALTSGDWVVSSIKAVAGDTVFFSGYRDTPLEQHLYSVPLAGGEPVRITAPGSTWSVTMASDGQSFVGTSSSPNQPPQTGLYKADGTLITWIEENALDETHPYAAYLGDHVAPEFGTLAAEDGQVLHYSILTPPGFDPARQYPVIIEVYGGPGVQRVTNSWQSLSDQYLAREGYVVFRLDNRGSSNRGKRFEDVIFRNMGDAEVRDQLAGVGWLKSQPFVDPARIAIQGWSYGGYMTLMTVLKAPEGTFAAGVSGAPVADWSLYDTFYTERYMDTPETNPDGYAASSVFPYLENLSAPLLMVHGMADDNVTFDNSTRVYAQLQELGKTFDVMTYPGQRHGIQGEALQIHLMRTRMAFLNRHLKGE